MLQAILTVWIDFEDRGPLAPEDQAALEEAVLDHLPRVVEAPGGPLVLDHCWCKLEKTCLRPAARPEAIAAHAAGEDA